MADEPAAALLASAVNPNEASPDQVLVGRPFWNQKPGTIQYIRSIGTMPKIGALNITPGTTPKVIPKGYHDGVNSKVAGDADLIATNIRAGVNLFGVVGNPNVVNTTVAPANAAAAGSILAGKSAFANGALVTGTMATRTASAAHTAQPAGYYNAFNLATVDPDLVAANIKAGATLFGVAGSPNVVDTGAGTAVAANIVAGKAAFVKGALVTGTMATQTPSAAHTAQPAGYYDTFNLATVDPDLVAANIKAGATLFGVAGSPNVADTGSGDAVAGDILAGKKAWVDGVEVFGTYEPTTPTATVASFPVAKTGQTTSYATNDDGDLQKGVAWPTPRFTDNSNGTVTDNLTGLIWLKNANCNATLNGIAKTGGLSWANAITWTAGLASGSCGLADNSTAGMWRLPSIRELRTLVDLGQNYPSLPSEHPFAGVQSSNYWSSSTYASYPADAWFVYFYEGFAGPNAKTTTYYVWPVRGGQ